MPKSLLGTVRLASIPPHQDLFSLAEKKAANAPTGSISSSVGFTAHPIGKDLVFDLGGGWYAMVATISRRVLPAAVVKQALAEECQRIFTEEGAWPKPKEKKAIREDIVDRLIPQAMLAPQHIPVFVNSIRQLVVMSTGSEASALAVLSLFSLSDAETCLRGQLITIPYLGGQLTSRLEQWLDNHQALAAEDQEVLTPGLELHPPLKMAGLNGKKLTVSAGTLDVVKDGIHEAITLAMGVEEIGLFCAAGRVSFTLTADLALKSMVFQGLTLEKKMSQDAYANQALAELGALEKAWAALVNEFSSKEAQAELGAIEQAFAALANESSGKEWRPE